MFFLTTYHYKPVMGWPQAGDLAHQAVLRTEQLLCPDQSDPALGGSNTCCALGSAVVRSGFWGQRAVLEAAMPWGKQGEHRGECQSIPLPLSLGEETSICCRGTYPHILADVHLSTPGLFILGVTEATRVTLFGTTPVWLWITSISP